MTVVASKNWHELARTGLVGVGSTEPEDVGRGAGPKEKKEKKKADV